MQCGRPNEAKSRSAMILSKLKQHLCLSCCALVNSGFWHLPLKCIQQFASQQRPTSQQVVREQSSESIQLQPALLLRPAPQTKQLPRQQQQQQRLTPSGRAFITLQQHREFSHSSKQQVQWPGQGQSDAEGGQQQQQRLEGPGGSLERWRTGGSGRWYSKHDLLGECRQVLKKPKLSCWSVFYERKPGPLASLLHFFRDVDTFFGLHDGKSLARLLFLSEHKRDAEMILPLAHADFELPSFKAFVKQALEESTSAYVKGDWAQLQSKVSGVLLESMQLARYEQAEVMHQQDVKLAAAQLTIDEADVSLLAAFSLTSEELATFDEQRARLQGSRKVVWDVACVSAEGVLYTLVEWCGEKSTIKLPKSGFYILCRGPVRTDRVLPAKQAAKMPWFLLTWL